MKSIAILTCLNATGVCSGASCFAALNKREKSFSAYKDEEVAVKAFFHCNGCSYEYDEDKKFHEKMNRVFSIGIDAVHTGVCTMTKEGECPTITKMIEMIEENDIRVVRGTH